MSAVTHFKHGNVIYGAFEERKLKIRRERINKALNELNSWLKTGELNIQDLSMEGLLDWVGEE